VGFPEAKALSIADKIPTNHAWSVFHIYRTRMALIFWDEHGLEMGLIENWHFKTQRVIKKSPSGATSL